MANDAFAVLKYCDTLLVILLVPGPRADDATFCSAGKFKIYGFGFVVRNAILNGISIKFVYLKRTNPLRGVGMATFYKPYFSDDSESESDSDGYTSEESLLNIAGKRPPVTVQPFQAIGDVAPITKAGAKFSVKESRNTTLFTINSRDRDASVYPQPTFFTIRLPRPFRNVKSINISQLNLLNSFFNFTTTKSNTTIYVYEQGRTTLDANLSTIKTVTPVTIRDGTYGVGDLVTELSNALNKTPLFADITFQNFYIGFQPTGDYSPLFNTPGPVVYNSLTETYDSNVTISDIIGRYFQTAQTLGKSNFSYNECLVAYYYPVIKEITISSNQTGAPLPFPLNDSNGNPLKDAQGNILATANDVYSYLVFSFTGLDDVVVLQIISVSANIPIFDEYRNTNSFNSSLVNQYTCTYNTKQGRLNIVAPNLNPSIQNDLNTQYNTYLNNLVIQNGFGSVAQFNSQYNAITYSNSIVLEQYNFIQSRFSSNFGINFGQYTANFYSDLQNTISIYNPINEFGWTTSLTVAVAQSQSNSIQPIVQISTLWRNIWIDSNLYDPSVFVNTIEVPEFGNNVLSFSNAGEAALGYTDVIINLPPTNYARIVFKSPCRQSLSIMSLPRYLTNRTNNDMIYNFGSNAGQTPRLFDFTTTPNTSYILTDPVGNTNLNLYNINQSMFADPGYMRNSDTWITKMTPQILNGILIQPTSPNFTAPPAKSDISINSYRPYIFFQVNADQYPVAPDARFQITFYIEKQDGTPFEAPLEFVISWYRDRAGFMADVQSLLDGKFASESPRHYFQQKTVSAANLTSISTTVKVNNLEKTFFLIRSAVNYNGPSVLPLRVFALLTDTYGFYSTPTTTQEAVENRYQMPFSTILSSLEKQYSPYNSFFTNSLSSIYDKVVFQLGYDSNGVSNNLLDYSIHGQNLNYYDPTNITDFNTTSSGLRYYFNYVNGGAAQPAPELSKTWSLFLGPTSSNYITDGYTLSDIYTNQNGTAFSSITANEFTLLNWYDPNENPKERFFIPNINGNYATKLSTSSVFLPCINQPTQLQTDIYPISSIKNIQYDASGFSGLSFFLPPNEVVKLDTILMKFAYTQPSSDAAKTPFSRNNTPLIYGSTINNNLNYNNRASKTDTNRTDISAWDDWYLYNRRNIKLGIFRTADIADKNISSIQLTSSLYTMTLDKVTQVANYQNQLGTLLTREPEWATYYKYSFIPKDTTVWDVVDKDWDPANTKQWRSTFCAADIAPVYYYGNVSSANYFQTHPVIYNYTYLPRSFGIAPAVGNAAVNPTLISSYTADIPNSYTIVPFYFDADDTAQILATDGVWRVGSFYGVTFTIQPAVPTKDILGAAPYNGPPGTYAWANTDDTMSLVSTPLSVFYWNTSIRYSHLDITNDPANDLTLFGNYTGLQHEYQDTMLFLYSNAVPDADLNDISKTISSFGGLFNDYWVWGQESAENYDAYDDQSGYNLLSYIYNKPVRGPNTEYAIHVRAYDPIPQFTTGVRFIGKNYTDFGTPSLLDIAVEISSLAGYQPISDTEANGYITNLNQVEPNYTPYAARIEANDAIRVGNGNRFSHAYADALIGFDRLFSTSVIFGTTVGYAGIPTTYTGYSNCIAQYSVFYSTTQGTLQTFTNILSTATVQLNEYVLSRYGHILPSTVISRNRITDPLPFQLLLSSFLLPPYTTQYDQWGLGYNLGFNKVDTAPSVSVTSATFIRIVDDYIYLQLNPEYNMNSLSVSGKEDKSMCLDSSAQESKYFSKILLNDFASFCRTAVQMPKSFNPVLGKYEMLSCQLLDRNGVPINNTDCEYDFVLEITEISNGPGDTDTLVAPNADLDVQANNF